MMHVTVSDMGKAQIVPGHSCPNHLRQERKTARGVLMLSKGFVLWDNLMLFHVPRRKNI